MSLELSVMQNEYFKDLFKPVCLPFSYNEQADLIAHITYNKNYDIITKELLAGSELHSPSNLSTHVNNFELKRSYKESITRINLDSFTAENSQSVSDSEFHKYSDSVTKFFTHSTSRRYNHPTLPIYIIVNGKAIYLVALLSNICLASIDLAHHQSLFSVELKGYCNIKWHPFAPIAIFCFHKKIVLTHFHLIGVETTYSFEQFFFKQVLKLTDALIIDCFVSLNIILFLDDSYKLYFVRYSSNKCNHNGIHETGPDIITTVSLEASLSLNHLLVCSLTSHRQISAMLKFYVEITEILLSYNGTTLLVSYRYNNETYNILVLMCTQNDKCNEATTETLLNGEQNLTKIELNKVKSHNIEYLSSNDHELITDCNSCFNSSSQFNSSFNKLMFKFFTIDFNQQIDNIGISTISHDDLELTQPATTNIWITVGNGYYLYSLSTSCDIVRISLKFHREVPLTDLSNPINNKKSPYKSKLILTPAIVSTHNLMRRISSNVSPYEDASLSLYNRYLALFFSNNELYLDFKMDYLIIIDHSCFLSIYELNSHNNRQFYCSKLLFNAELKFRVSKIVKAYVCSSSDVSSYSSYKLVIKKRIDHTLYIPHILLYATADQNMMLLLINTICVHQTRFVTIYMLDCECSLSLVLSSRKFITFEQDNSLLSLNNPDITKPNSTDPIESNYLCILNHPALKVDTFKVIEVIHFYIKQVTLLRNGQLSFRHNDGYDIKPYWYPCCNSVNTLIDLRYVSSSFKSDDIHLLALTTACELVFLKAKLFNKLNNLCIIIKVISTRCCHSFIQTCFHDCNNKNKNVPGLKVGSYLIQRQSDSFDFNVVYTASLKIDNNTCFFHVQSRIRPLKDAHEATILMLKRLDELQYRGDIFCKLVSSYNDMFIVYSSDNSQAPGVRITIKSVSDDKHWTIITRNPSSNEILIDCCFMESWLYLYFSDSYIEVIDIYNKLNNHSLKLSDLTSGTTDKYILDTCLHLDVNDELNLHKILYYYPVFSLLQMNTIAVGFINLYFKKSNSKSNAAIRGQQQNVTRLSGIQDTEVFSFEMLKQSIYFEPWQFFTYRAASVAINNKTQERLYIENPNYLIILSEIQFCLSIYKTTVKCETCYDFITEVYKANTIDFYTFNKLFCYLNYKCMFLNENLILSLFRSANLLDLVLCLLSVVSQPYVNYERDRSLIMLILKSNFSLIIMLRENFTISDQLENMRKPSDLYNSISYTSQNYICTKINEVLAYIDNCPSETKSLFMDTYNLISYLKDQQCFTKLDDILTTKGLLYEFQEILLAYPTSTTSSSFTKLQMEFCQVALQLYNRQYTNLLEWDYNICLQLSIYSKTQINYDTLINAQLIDNSAEIFFTNIQNSPSATKLTLIDLFNFGLSFITFKNKTEARVKVKFILSKCILTYKLLSDKLYLDLGAFITYLTGDLKSLEIYYNAVKEAACANFVSTYNADEPSLFLNKAKRNAYELLKLHRPYAALLFFWLAEKQNQAVSLIFSHCDNLLVNLLILSVLASFVDKLNHSVKSKLYKEVSELVNSAEPVTSMFLKKVQASFSVDATNEPLLKLSPINANLVTSLQLSQIVLQSDNQHIESSRKDHMQQFKKSIFLSQVFLNNFHLVDLYQVNHWQLFYGCHGDINVKSFEKLYDLFQSSRSISSVEKLYSRLNYTMSYEKTSSYSSLYSYLISLLSIIASYSTVSVLRQFNIDWQNNIVHSFLILLHTTNDYDVDNLILQACVYGLIFIYAIDYEADSFNNSNSIIEIIKKLNYEQLSYIINETITLSTIKTAVSQAIVVLQNNVQNTITRDWKSELTHQLLLYLNLLCDNIKKYESYTVEAMAKSLLLKRNLRSYNLWDHVCVIKNSLLFLSKQSNSILTIELVTYDSLSNHDVTFIFNKNSYTSARQVAMPVESIIPHPYLPIFVVLYTQTDQMPSFSLITNKTLIGAVYFVRNSECYKIHNLYIAEDFVSYRKHTRYSKLKADKENHVGPSSWINSGTLFCYCRNLTCIYLFDLVNSVYLLAESINSIENKFNQKFQFIITDRPNVNDQLLSDEQLADTPDNASIVQTLFDFAPFIKDHRKIDSLTITTEMISEFIILKHSVLKGLFYLIVYTPITGGQKQIDLIRNNNFKPQTAMKVDNSTYQSLLKPVNEYLTAEKVHDTTNNIIMCYYLESEEQLILVFRSGLLVLSTLCLELLSLKNVETLHNFHSKIKQVHFFNLQSTSCMVTLQNNQLYIARNLSTSRKLEIFQFDMNKLETFNSKVLNNTNKIKSRHIINNYIIIESTEKVTVYLLR